MEIDFPDRDRLAAASASAASSRAIRTRRSVAGAPGKNIGRRASALAGAFPMNL
jgi:hypothetical protein